MQKIFGSPRWKTHCTDQGVRLGALRVANSIIKLFRKGMGLSEKEEGIEKGYPMPWNYFDMATLCLTEFGHNRIIGILGTIVSVIEKLIPPWHIPDVHLLFQEDFSGGGFSRNCFPTPKGKDSTHTRMSRKAMKIWNTALYYMVDGKLWGIHHHVTNFLRMHLMVASRWFSSHHSLRDHVIMRTHLVGCEVRLKRWRLPTNRNEQTKLLANRFYATDNAKNLLPSNDMFAGPWGVVRSAFLLKYESFHLVSVFLFCANQNDNHLPLHTLLFRTNLYIG